MRIEYFKTLYAYNYGSYRHLWDCIEQLNDAQFCQEVNYSVGSLRNHYIHLIGVDSRWLARLKGIPVPDFLKNEDFSERAATRVRWETVAEAVLAYVNSLNQAALDEIVHFDMPQRGGAKQNPRWQILQHVVNHGTDHRAQMLRILHDLGAPTFEQDFMIYLWEH
jgi:uncharacterized damage-inducible protein DinB